MSTAAAGWRWIPFAALAVVELAWLGLLGWLAWRG
jgi:hypothetical protein